MTEQEEDLLTDSGSILCCSRKAENSTNRNGYDKKKKIIMDIKIYLTKIINSNLLKSTKFFLPLTLIEMDFGDVDSSFWSKRLEIILF